jgi:5-deoxy-glucuronate isomerase
VSYLLRAGEAAGDGLALRITPEQAGWTFCGLRVLHLAAGESRTIVSGDDELIVLPLSGSCDVTCEGHTYHLAGRGDVFAGPSDFIYVPRDGSATIASAAGGRFALPSARATIRLEPRYVPASAVPVELRGAGAASRQVHNFCAPEAFAADRLIAVEVITPGGNTSSYPPHKHDVDVPGGEVALEEIYYYEVAGDGLALQRAYGARDGVVLDICEEVRSGDAILLPFGYHGPSVALPGYDLYYLNVMAGASERAWRFTDDPPHAWIRGTWADQAIDPRLPYGGGPR